MNNEKPRLWTRNFVLIIVINFLVFMNHIMLLSTFPFYIESLGGSEALAGLAATLFSLVAVLCRPVVGWMLDNGKRRAILLIGLAGMLLMPLGYMFASVIFLAFVFRMVHGASLALSNTATATIASDVIPAPRFAEGMGMFGMATALATSCAPALGLYLMDSFSYTVLFACASGSVLIALILFAILKNPPINAEKKPLNVSALFSRAAVPASVIALVFMLTFGALENFLAKYAVEAELPSGGLFFAIMAVMLLLVRVVLGKYADKKGEAMFVYTCNAAMLAAFLLLALAPNTVTFILAAVLAGYGFGGLQRPDKNMTAHIQSNGACLNFAENFVIENNIFELSTYDLINAQSRMNTLPVLRGNTYIQNENRRLGSYSGYLDCMFDSAVGGTVKKLWHDEGAKINSPASYS